MALAILENTPYARRDPGWSLRYLMFWFTGTSQCKKGVEISITNPKK
jgi:hypothetical protein